MMTPDEIASRLKTAADIEIGGINYLELLAHWGGGGSIALPVLDCR